MPGWLVLFLVIIILGLMCVFKLYPFLALSAPRADAEIAIVEGWLNDDELNVVCSMVPSGTLWVASGGPLELGADLFGESNFAELLARRLVARGVSQDDIVVASAPRALKDRTFTSAQAVYAALQRRGCHQMSANLYSVAAHSRRSFFLYRSVFGFEAPIGVVSVEGEGRDYAHWWRGSLTFKHVISELISWCYTQATWWKYSRA